MIGIGRLRFMGVTALYGMSLALLGCTISVLFVDSVVEEGGIVTVVLEGDPDGASGGASVQHLIARVPESWTLASSTFSGTSAGTRVVGSGVEIAASCTCLCNPPVGMKDVRIAPAQGGVAFTGSDSVTMTLRFVAGSPGLHTPSFMLCFESPSNIVQTTVEVLPGGSGLLFADGFESADTSSWSQSLAIDNGGFELGDQSWNLTSITGVDPIVGPGETPVTPFAGDWIGQLGGVDNEVTSLSPAEFLLPVTPYRLVYRKWLASSEPTCNSNDFFAIWVNNSVPGEEDLCVASNTAGWVEGSLDLGAWAGQWVVMYFSGYTDEDDPSAVYLDEIALRNFGN